jgi:hypothetical protein
LKKKKKKTLSTDYKGFEGLQIQTPKARYEFQTRGEEIGGKKEEGKPSKKGKERNYFVGNFSFLFPGFSSQANRK